jgi:hypothetical protein
MTHDELLDRIAEDIWLHGNVMPTHLVLALRAVVELHKPSLVKPEECETCTLHTDYSERYIAYPCETIQAIEKELG